MKRIFTIFTAIALATGLFAGTALAGGHEWHEDVPAHGHVLLLGAELTPLGLSYDRCVDLAGGEALPTPAHHHSIHTGKAGGSPIIQGALWQAGHAVIPLNPFVPFQWFGCEDIPNPIPFF